MKFTMFVVYSCFNSCSMGCEVVLTSIHHLNYCSGVAGDRQRESGSGLAGVRRRAAGSALAADWHWNNCCPLAGDWHWNDSCPLASDWHWDDCYLHWNKII